MRELDWLIVIGIVIAGASLAVAVTVNIIKSGDGPLIPEDSLANPDAALALTNMITTADEQIRAVVRASHISSCRDDANVLETVAERTGSRALALEAQGWHLLCDDKEDQFAADFRALLNRP